MAEVAAHRESAKTPPRLCLFRLRHHPEQVEEHVPLAHLECQSRWPAIISSTCAGVFFSVAIYLPLMANPENRCCCNPNAAKTLSGYMYLDKERSGYGKSTEVSLTAISRGFETRLIADLPFCPSSAAEALNILRRATDSPVFRPLRRSIVPGPMRPTVALYVRAQGMTVTYARRNIDGYYFACDNLVLGRLELGDHLETLRAKFQEAASLKVEPLLADPVTFTDCDSDTEYSDSD